MMMMVIIIIISCCDSHVCMHAAIINSHIGAKRLS
jgi:hypothetical protein